MSKAFVSSGRAALVTLAVAFAFCVLLGRLFYLQVWDQESLRAHVENNRKMINVVEARRGNIVDTRGNLLAITRTSYNIGLDPHALRESDWEKLPQVARLLGLPLSEVERAAGQKYRQVGEHGPNARPVRWAVLARGANEATHEAIRALGIRAIYGNQTHARAYPSGQLAAHLLGYINKEATPVTGIERYFDYYLRGQDGWRETERDGRRHEIARFREREVEPSNGLSVELTIDQMVQHIVEAEIQRLSEEFNPQGISIIVSQPGTGAVLAMANYPTYDPNEFYDLTKYPFANQRNRALTDVFEPGSTFKIVPAAAALNEGLVHPQDVVQTGVKRVSYRGRTLSLPDDHRNYDELSVHDIMVKSSNRGVAHLGLLLGESRLHQYAAKFGFGERTGFNLGGEVQGTLHNPRNWDGLTITRLPMGHAVSATPMQVHTAMSVIANKGVLMEPMLAKRVFDASGNDVVQFHPKAKRRVVSVDAAYTVARMLSDAVSVDGTARRAVIENYDVAGKTGTTQKIVAGRYSNQHHVASFSGFFPAENPALVITVVVDEPQGRGTGYGGAVAAPAFRNIAEACIAYLGIRPARSDASLVDLNSLLYDRSRRISN